MTIPAGYAQATFLFTGTALPNGAACTLGLEPNPGDSPADVGTDLSLIVNASNIMVHVYDAVQMNGILVKFGPDATGPSALVPVSWPGQDTDPAANCNTAWLIHKQTAMGGRQGRGRIYWPGPPQAKVNSNGTVLAATLATLVGQWHTFFQDCISAGHNPVLLHADGSTPTPLTDMVPDSRVATQRRRLRH